MEYKFSLDENDYLTHQLFVVSTHQPAIWRRRKSWAIITGIFLIFALLFYQNSNDFLMNYFLVAAVVSLIFYPFYSRWKYKRHYKTQVNEHFSKTFGKESIVQFMGDYILTTDQDNSESKINYSQVESMHELPEHFLIRLNNGQSLIMPKNKISAVEQLKPELMRVSDILDIELTNNIDWKWK